MLLRALWLRPTLARPARALATIAGVALGVASVVSTLLASRAAVASMADDVEVIAGRARLEATRPGGFELAALGPLRELCGDALLAPVVEGTVLAPGLGDLVRVLGVDLLVDSEVRPVELDTGARDLEQARHTMLLGQGAALPAGLASELGLEVGDLLELVVDTRPVALEVAALYAPERFATAWSRVVLVDVALAQEILGRGERIDRLELRPRREVDLAELAARATALLPEGTRVAPASVRRAEGENLVRALDFNLTALAGVSVLVGVVLVGTTLATSVVQRREKIALLRSLGASRAQLFRAVLLEASAIGLLGGAIGVALGWVGARAALGSVRATVLTIAHDALPGAVRLDVDWIVAGLAIGLASAVLAALLPLREAARTPPLQGLLTEHPESVARRPWRARLLALAALVAGAALFALLPPLGDRPVFALVSALLLLSTLLVVSAPFIDLLAGVHLGLMRTRAATPLRLAQAALEAGRRRAAWASSAVGVAVGLAVSMTVMVGSFRRTVVDWTSQAMRSDLFVRTLPAASGAPGGRIDPAVERAARSLLGDESVDPYHQSTAYFRDAPIALGGAELAVVAREGGVPFVDGRDSRDVFRAALEQGGALVNEPFARRFGVRRGEELELRTAAGLVQREVVGVYRDYSAHTGRVVLDLADYLALQPDAGPLNLALFVPEGGDVEALRGALLTALGGRFAVEVLNNRELQSEILAVFERTFAVTVALQLVASVVAGIAVVTVLTALVEERRRELAIVRSLGGSRVQLATLVVGEALLLGLAGTLGGLLVGLAVGWVLVAVVNVQSFGWTLQFAPPWASLLRTLAFVVPACLLAGLIPAFLSLRHTPREALREAL